MAIQTPATASWDKVERISSLFLLIVLAMVIVTRLGFADVWQLPRVDFWLSVVALGLVLGALWLARQSRRSRLAIIAFAAGTQLLPMVLRDPMLLLPLLGALIPVAILLGCLVALSRKGPRTAPPARS